MTRCYLCNKVVDDNQHCKLVHGLPKWFHAKCWKAYRAGLSPERYHRALLCSLYKGDTDDSVLQ